MRPGSVGPRLAVDGRFPRAWWRCCVLCAPRGLGRRSGMIGSVRLDRCFGHPENFAFPGMTMQPFTHAAEQRANPFARRFGGRGGGKGALAQAGGLNGSAVDILAAAREIAVNDLKAGRG